MDEPNLAELTEADLDDATLAQLLVDILDHTKLLDVLVKGGAERHTDRVRMDLGPAVDQLRAGSIAGVQIRYVWQEAEWRDTLMRTPGGIRLVRMRMDF